jgi:hypothetical protein
MDQEEIRYGGVHTFVFIDQVDPGVNVRTVIDELRRYGPPPEGPVMFASEMVGSYLAFAHVRTDGLAELQDVIAGGLWERGAHSKHLIEAGTATVAGQRTGAKRDTPEVIALSRLRVRRGALDDVLDAVADPSGPLSGTFKGASLVFGDFDVLLQLGADDFATVAAAARGPLQQVEGIVSCDTAFTDARRYDD